MSHSSTVQLMSAFLSTKDPPKKSSDVWEKKKVAVSRIQKRVPHLESILQKACIWPKIDTISLTNDKQKIICFPKNKMLNLNVFYQESKIILNEILRFKLSLYSNDNSANNLMYPLFIFIKLMDINDIVVRDILFELNKAEYNENVEHPDFIKLLRSFVVIKEKEEELIHTSYSHLY